MEDYYDTHCWFCGGYNLVSDTRGVRCTDCGTTYNIILKPGSLPITMREDNMTAQPSSSPSSHLTKHLPKVRGSKLK